MIKKIYYDTSNDGQSIFGYANGCKQVTDRYAKKIVSCAFRCCSSFTSIILPSLTEIESYAFCGCTILNSIRDLSSVNHIGRNAFEN